MSFAFRAQTLLSLLSWLCSSAGFLFSITGLIKVILFNVNRGILELKKVQLNCTIFFVDFRKNICSSSK